MNFNEVPYEIDTMNTCSDCHETKNLSDFYFRKESNTYRQTCKLCFKQNRKQYRDTNKENIQESKKQYYYENQEICCKRSRDWYAKNKEIKNEKHVVYIRNRRRTDNDFKVYSNIQSRIYSALHSNNVKKIDNTLDIIGCSIAFYKSWLEYQFDDNMNWDNHGNYWHIDHVKPCESYNMSDDNELKECFNWSNVRPVEKTLNLIKNDKIDNVLIESHKNLVKTFATKLASKDASGSEQKTEV